jgi:hypothetical protein
MRKWREDRLTKEDMGGTGIGKNGMRRGDSTQKGREEEVVVGVR